MQQIYKDYLEEITVQEKVSYRERLSELLSIRVERFFGMQGRTLVRANAKEMLKALRYYVSTSVQGSRVMVLIHGGRLVLVTRSFDFYAVKRTVFLGPSDITGMILDCDFVMDTDNCSPWLVVRDVLCVNSLLVISSNLNERLASGLRLIERLIAVQETLKFCFESYIPACRIHVDMPSSKFSFDGWTLTPDNKPYSFGIDECVFRMVSPLSSQCMNLITMVNLEKNPKCYGALEFQSSGDVILYAEGDKGVKVPMYFADSTEFRIEAQSVTATYNMITKKWCQISRFSEQVDTVMEVRRKENVMRENVNLLTFSSMPYDIMPSVIHLNKNNVTENAGVAPAARMKVHLMQYAQKSLGTSVQAILDATVLQIVQNQVTMRYYHHVCVYSLTDRRVKMFDAMIEEAKKIDREGIYLQCGTCFVKKSYERGFRLQQFKCDTCITTRKGKKNGPKSKFSELYEMSSAGITGDKISPIAPTDVKNIPANDMLYSVVVKDENIKHMYGDDTFSVSKVNNDYDCDECPELEQEPPFLNVTELDSLSETKTTDSSSNSGDCLDEHGHTQNDYHYGEDYDPPLDFCTCKQESRDDLCYYCSHQDEVGDRGWSNDDGGIESDEDHDFDQEEYDQFMEMRQYEDEENNENSRRLHGIRAPASKQVVPTVVPVEFIKEDDIPPKMIPVEKDEDGIKAFSEKISEKKEVSEPQVKVYSFHDCVRIPGTNWVQGPADGIVDPDTVPYDLQPEGDMFGKPLENEDDDDQSYDSDDDSNHQEENEEDCGSGDEWPVFKD